MICPHCGKGTSQDSVFCAFCGAKITPDVSAPSNLPDDTPSFSDKPADPALADSQPPVIVQVAQKKKTGWLIAFAVVAILIIAALLVTGISHRREIKEATSGPVVVAFQNSSFLNGLLRAELVRDRILGKNDVDKIAKINGYSVTRAEPAEYNEALYFVEGQIDWVDDVNKPFILLFDFSILFTGDHVPAPEEIQTFLENGQYEMQGDFAFSNFEK